MVIDPILGFYNKIMLSFIKKVLINTLVTIIFPRQ